MSGRTSPTVDAAAASARAASNFAVAQGESGTATPTADGPQSGYASVNGLDLYYEVHGAGEPLVLLHGGLLTIDMIEPLVTALAASRQVIAVELEGHGHTPLLDRPLTFEQMADDVAALIEQLGLEQTDVFGFSHGGGVAWQIAIRHPERVRKLIVASAPIKTAGWAPEVLEAVGGLNAEAAAAMAETPFYQAYVSVAPNPEDWPNLVTKVGQLMTGTGENQTYDWSPQIKEIAAPTLVIVGDADSVILEQTVELFRLLGGGVIGDFAPLPNAQLAIVPGTAHSAVLTRTDLLIPVIVPFLDAPMPEAS